jgi:glutaredoxin 3
MSLVRMYSSGACPFCVMAKRLLGAKGVGFEEIRVDQDYSRREEMMRITGRRTVPQIFIGETHVGGFDDLSALERAGQLDPLLEATLKATD